MSEREGEREKEREEKERVREREREGEREKERERERERKKERKKERTKERLWEYDSNTYVYVSSINPAFQIQHGGSVSYVYMYMHACVHMYIP